MMLLEIRLRFYYLFPPDKSYKASELLVGTHFKSSALHMDKVVTFDSIAVCLFSNSANSASIAFRFWHFSSPLGNAVEHLIAYFTIVLLLIHLIKSCYKLKTDM